MNDIYRGFGSKKGYYKEIHVNKMAGFVWRYLFSKNVIDKNRLFFYEDVKYGEDVLFLTRYLTKANRLELIDEELYQYRIREDSAMHQPRSVEEKIRSLEARDRILEDLTDESARDFMEEKWNGQALLIALNGARKHNYKGYIKLVKCPSIQRVLVKVDLKRLPLKYRIPISFLKFHVYFIYWIAFNIGSKLFNIKLGS